MTSLTRFARPQLRRRAFDALRPRPVAVGRQLSWMAPALKFVLFVSSSPLLREDLLVSDVLAWRLEGETRPCHRRTMHELDFKKKL